MLETTDTDADAVNGDAFSTWRGVWRGLDGGPLTLTFVADFPLLPGTTP